MAEKHTGEGNSDFILRKVGLVLRCVRIMPFIYTVFLFWEYTTAMLAYHI